MMILQKNNVRLVKDETSMRNPDSSPIIYLTAPKAEQFKLVEDNRREKKENSIEKEETRREIRNKTFT